MNPEELQTILDQHLAILKKAAALINSIVDDQIAINDQTVTLLEAQKRQLLNK